MKHILLPFASTITILLLLSSIANGDDIVYDVEGNELVAGGTFHIVPNAYNAEGGGFYWKQSNHEYYIYQVEDKLDFGLPITFYPVTPGQNTITLSSKINIAFPDETPPRTSNLWKVENNKVLLGGRRGGFDRQSVFKLKELDSGGYSINFCTSATTCDDGLGIDPSFKVTGVRKLVVNATDPLAVNFEPRPLFAKKYSILTAA